MIGRWAVCLAALAAAGCATNVAEQQACPSAKVVREFSNLTQFLPGPGRDLTDVVIEAKVDSVDGFCQFDLENDGSGEVEVDMEVFFQAALGPSNDTRSAEFVYFVALLDKERNVLRKPIFDAVLTFPSNASRVQFSDEIAVDFRLEAGEPAADYEILVGFQLTDEEAEYNRKAGL